MGVIFLRNRELTSLRLVDDSFANDYSILEPLEKTEFINYQLIQEFADVDGNQKIWALSNEFIRSKSMKKYEIWALSNNVHLFQIYEKI